MAWTFVSIGSEFSTTSDTPVSVTGLAFTPAANKTYWVIGSFLVKTSNTATGVRPGVTWPSGVTAQAGSVRAAESGGTGGSQGSNLLRYRSTPSSVSTPDVAQTVGAPDVDNYYWAGFEGMIVTGATPSGDLQVVLCSETNGTTVYMGAGSCIAYQEVA